MKELKQSVAVFLAITFYVCVVVQEVTGFEWQNNDENITEGGVGDTARVTDNVFPMQHVMSDAFVDCRRMINSQPPIAPLRQLNFYTGENGQRLADGWSTASGYPIHHVIRFHAIGSALEDREITHLCVGMDDATSFTYSDKPADGGRPIAWITTHSRPEQAVGFVKLTTRCWKIFKKIASCSPEYYPAPFIHKLRQFRKSPLDELFWSNFSSTKMKLPSKWIWKININLNDSTRTINIPPQWIYNMDISKLYELEIQGNNWEKPEKILGYISSLLYLDLSNNNLQVVPSDMLSNTPNLLSLNLSYNNISKYPDGIKNLKKLKYLDISFSHSQTALNISEDNIKNIPDTLEVLKSEYTLLGVNIVDLLLLRRLEFLNVSGCSLKGFPFDNTPNLGHGTTLNETNLTEIDFSSNIISTLTSDTFRKLSVLQILNLSRNHIEYIDVDSFQYNLLLITISLSHNGLEFIPSCLFSKLNKLQNIDLSYNRLKQLPFFVHAKLRYLGLAFNTLNEFQQNDSFIDYVDLSHNNVSKLTISLVKTLNLSYNSLSFIDTEMWYSINRLQIVDLGGNRFGCCQLRDIFPSEKHNTVVLNLGTSEPLMCSENGKFIEYITNTTYDVSSCQRFTENESMTIGIQIFIALAIFFVFVIIIALLFRLIHACLFIKSRPKKNLF